MNQLGNVSVLTNVTLTQLLDEASVRWPSLWFAEEPRLTCLVIIPRRSRPEMEHHGFFVEHLHPVFGLFYRPRDEASTIKASGFDPLSASFQFLNLAVSDLGLWMGKLTEELDYERAGVMIEPLPSSASSSLRLGFEAFEITTFRHRSLSGMERLPLVMPPLSLVSKAFLSIPESAPPLGALTSQIPAEQESSAEDIIEAEALGDAVEAEATDENHDESPGEPEETPLEEVGPLDEVPPPATGAEPAQPILPDAQSEAETEESVTPADDGPEAAEVPTEAAVEERGEEPVEVVAEEPVTHVIVDEGVMPTSDSDPASQAPTPATPEIVAEQIDLPSEGIESEFRMIVQRLMAEGLDHNTIMEDAEFQMISDRAQAAGINTWQLFLRIAT